MAEFMIDAQKLLRCFPDPVGDMMVSEQHGRLLIINTAEDYDPDASRISLETASNGVTLRFISISHGYQGEGYCKKILTALFDMCCEQGLILCVDKACKPVEHIFDSLIRNCPHIKDYTKIPPTENEWLGPNLEINFLKPKQV